MRTLTKILLMLAVVSLPLHADAQTVQSYRVIVHPSNPVSSMTKKEVSRYFLKKTTRWSNGSKVLPVDQQARATVRKSFTKAIHKKSSGQIDAFWQGRIFSGAAVPPLQRSSDSAVIAYVLGNPGAIGYVSSTADVGRAKVVTVK